MFGNNIVHASYALSDVFALSAGFFKLAIEFLRLILAIHGDESLEFLRIADEIIAEALTFALKSSLLVGNFLAGNTIAHESEAEIGH